MTDDTPKKPEETTPTDTSLRAEPKRLAAIRTASADTGNSQRYSTVVRRLRLALPIIALGLIAIVFTLTGGQDMIVQPEKQPADMPDKAAQNEVLNPRFESMDEKQQPYTITAKSATQSAEDDKLIILVEPRADMQLTSGHRIGAQAADGTFRQDNHMLDLDQQVILTHDLGYEMTLDRLSVDMTNSTAQSDSPVSAHGPAGTLEAKGLRADAEKGDLIFSGPAKLILNRTVKIPDLSGGTK